MAIPINAIHYLSGIQKEINKAYRKMTLKRIELYVNRLTTPKLLFIRNFLCFIFKLIRLEILVFFQLNR